MVKPPPLSNEKALLSHEHLLLVGRFCYLVEHPAPLLNIFIQMEWKDLGREMDALGCQAADVVDSAFQINSGKEKKSREEGWSRRNAHKPTNVLIN